jgi:hypothetical protein
MSYNSYEREYLEYVFVSDDIDNMELSPRYVSEDKCLIWYGQVAHELFDEFDIKPTKMSIK